MYSMTTTDSDIQYGKHDNEYITPYLTTVFYHESSRFETAISVLLQNARMVNLDDKEDTARDHISPYVLVFGNHFSRDELLSMLESGYQQIIIYTNSPIYTAELDERIVQVDANSVMDYVKIGSLINAYVLECVLCAYCPDYRPVMDLNVDHKRGKLLMEGLTTGDFTANLLKVCSSYRGFDLIDAFIQKAQTRAEIMDEILTDALRDSREDTLEQVFGVCEKSIQCNAIYALKPPGCIDVDKLKTHPLVAGRNLDAIVFASYSPSNEPQETNSNISEYCCNKMYYTIIKLHDNVDIEGLSVQ